MSNRGTKFRGYKYLVEDNDEEEEVKGGPGYTDTGEIFEKFKQFHNVVF